MASMGGVDGWRRWLASNGGVDGWRRWWTGVFDTEGIDVEVPLCPHSGSLVLRLNSLHDDGGFCPCVAFSFGDSLLRILLDSLGQLLVSPFHRLPLT